MNILLDLFLTFAKIGMFTFGGGYAMLSVVENSCVEKKKWISCEDMMNLTVVAEATPGPVAINCATFVGYRQKGFIGAIVATIGMILPSFAIIHIIAYFLDNFLEIAIIANAFKGIKLAVGLLILDAAFSLIKKQEKKTLTVTVTIAATVIMLAINAFSINFSSISLMIIAGAVSFCVFLIERSKTDNISEADGKETGK